MDNRTTIPDLRQWLSVLLLPESISEARVLLEIVNSSITYLNLFQYYFPAEFARSIQQQELLPPPGEAYSRLELRFLKLVERHLFPLPYWVFDDRGADNRCFSVPIEPMGVASLFEYGSIEDGFEQLDLGWQLLYYLDGHVTEAHFDGLFDEDDSARGIFTLPLDPEPMNNAVLRARCEACQEPLCYLYHAMNMLNHDTGIAWLDAVYDQPFDDVPWDRQTLDTLAEQWLAAEEIQGSVTQLLCWLEADVFNHFQEVIHLWNQCIHESRALSIQREEK